MTLTELIFAVLNTVKPNNMTNTSITEELVKFHIKNTRAQLIKQEANKGNSIDSYIIQSLGCITLEEVDQSECCDVPSGCVILRTNVEIPSPIEMYNRQLITRVGPVNKIEKPWQQIEYERVPFEGLNKYTRGLVKWFTMNNNRRIYILVPENDYILKGIEYIAVDGVWEDPEKVSDFTNCATGESCFTAKSEFPIKDWMANAIIEMVIKKFILLQASQPIDVSNDNKTNPDTTVNKGI